MPKRHTFRPIGPDDEALLFRSTPARAGGTGARALDGRRKGRLSAACSSTPSTAITKSNSRTLLISWFCSATARRPALLAPPGRRVAHHRHRLVAGLSQRGLRDHAAARSDSRSRRRRQAGSHPRRAFNPALRLYERLGFSRIADTGVYFLMERAGRRRPHVTRRSICLAVFIDPLCSHSIFSPIFSLIWRNLACKIGELAQDVTVGRSARTALPY